MGGLLLPANDRIPLPPDRRESRELPRDVATVQINMHADGVTIIQEGHGMG